jgi:hypothetical protein
MAKKKKRKPAKRKPAKRKPAKRVTLADVEFSALRSKLIH